MGIEARCGNCGADYLLADHLAGKTVRCKRCGNPFTVPVRLDELEVIESPPVTPPPPPPRHAPAPAPQQAFSRESFESDPFGDDPDHGHNERADVRPRPSANSQAQTQRGNVEPDVEALLAPADGLTQLDEIDEVEAAPPLVEQPPEQIPAFDVLDIAGPSGRPRTWFLILLAAAILCLVHPSSAYYATFAMLAIGGIWTLAGMVFWLKEAFRWGYEPVKLFIPFHPVFWTIQHVRLVPDSSAAVVRGLVLLLMALPLWLVAQTAR